LSSVPYIYPLFFFSSFCHPRDLHSFPTRRSSDLGGRERHEDARLTPGAQLGDCHRPGSRDHEIGRAVHRRHRVEESLDDHPPREDRKSTRLNSSHVAISYAVFCLKKKKKIPYYCV